MTEKKQIYKCNICGNVVEVLHTGVGQLVCCGQPMELLGEKTEEEGLEKHLPVMEVLPPSACQGRDGVLVKVGQVPHPMEEGHFIEWIEVETLKGKAGKHFLKPGDSPEVEFNTRDDIVAIRAFCNIHGLWKTKT